MSDWTWMQLENRPDLHTQTWRGALELYHSQPAGGIQTEKMPPDWLLPTVPWRVTVFVTLASSPGQDTSKQTAMNEENVRSVDFLWISAAGYIQEQSRRKSTEAPSTDQLTWATCGVSSRHRRKSFSLGSLPKRLIVPTGGNDTETVVEGRSRRLRADWWSNRRKKHSVNRKSAFWQTGSDIFTYFKARVHMNSMNASWGWWCFDEE